jgi:hypothetical protein
MKGWVQESSPLKLNLSLHFGLRSPCLKIACCIEFFESAPDKVRRDFRKRTYNSTFKSPRILSGSRSTTWRRVFDNRRLLLLAVSYIRSAIMAEGKKRSSYQNLPRISAHLSLQNSSVRNLDQQDEATIISVRTSRNHSP